MSWRSRIELSVERGLRGTDVGEAVWDTATWDTAASWSALEPAWIPLVGAEVESFSSTRGRESGTQRHSPGSAELHLVWPSPENGQWSFRDDPPITLGMEVRLRARRIGTATWRPIFRGAVREVLDGFSRSGAFRVTARQVDRMAELGAVNLVAMESAVGLGDTTDARLLRILALASIPAEYTDLDASLTEMASSLFARNLLDEAQVTVESDIGQWYADRNGQLVFKHRFALQTDLRSSSPQVAWANDGSGVAPRTFGTGSTLQDVRNRVSMANAGGTAVTVSDEASILAYGLRTYQRMDLVNRYKVDVEAVADFILAQHASRTRHVDALSVELGHQTDAALDALLDIELGDLHTLDWDDGTVTPFTASMHVQGVSHVISPDSWQVSVRLWDYAGFTPAAGWSVAVWDTDDWAA